MKRRLLETTSANFKYIWEQKCPNGDWSIIYHAVPGKYWMPYTGHEFQNVTDVFIQNRNNQDGELREIGSDEDLFVELL